MNTPPPRLTSVSKSNDMTSLLFNDIASLHFVVSGVDFCPLLMSYIPLLVMWFLSDRKIIHPRNLGNR